MCNLNELIRNARLVIQKVKLLYGKFLVVLRFIKASYADLGSAGWEVPAHNSPVKSLETFLSFI